MRYARVIAGVVTQVGLPASGTLGDGRTVSNYLALPLTVLTSEGWLPLVDNPPVFDPATQQLTSDGFDIAVTTVTARYLVGPHPIEQINTDARRAKIAGARARAQQITALAQTPAARTSTAWTQVQRVAILDAVGDMAKMLSWLADAQLGAVDAPD